MRHARHILSGAVAALLALTTGALAKPAYVASTVNLRAAAGTGSEIVGKIPGGSLVDASECKDGWCAVTWQAKAGFAIESALDMSGRVPQRRVTRVIRRPVYGPTYYYEEPPVYYAPPPLYGPGPFFGRPFFYGGYHRRHWHHHW